MRQNGERRLDEPVFGCVVEPDRDLVTVRLVGELDLATTPIVETALADLRETGFAEIVVDLRQVTFIACATVHVLLTQDAALLACGGRLGIIPAPEAVDRIFDLAGVRGRLSFVEAGAASLRPGGETA